MSEASAPPPAAAATQEQQQPAQQPPHQVQPQAPVSASGASSNSNASSRRAAASSAASSSNSATRATPATTLSARNNAAGHQQQQQQGRQPAPLLETLPSAETQRHIAEARAAVVASIGNMLDTELQSRATVLHENAGALDKQERDVLAATDGLRREREKLAREADGAARKLKEVGNVQNWAEVLERGFLVLEETVRLANRGDEDSDGYGSWSGPGSASECSCSDCGRTLDGEPGGDQMDVDEGAKNGQVEDKGKGKEVDVPMEGVGAISDASRSLYDGESSTANGTGMAKNSETASLSTTC